MAGTGSPSPFIKDEPEDQSFGPNQPDGFMSNSSTGYPSNSQQTFNHFDQAVSGSIDPSELSMFQSGNNLQSYPQNVFSTMGQSNIPDDELLDLVNFNSPNADQGSFPPATHEFNGQNSFPQGNGGHSSFQDHGQGEALDMTQPDYIGQVFSHTPDGAPIQSPFIQPNYHPDQYRQRSQQQQHQQQMMSAMRTPSSYNASPRGQPGSVPGSYENSFMNGKPRAKAPHGMERKTSHSRSPMTPKTPALGVGGLNLGTPESGSFPSQPIHTNHFGNRHQKSFSNQWDSTPGSMPSQFDSPISSPGQMTHTPQISDVLKSGKHASLPDKVENGHHLTGMPTYQTQEAKRRRRRESHNMVERRRRDNINERIQELSHLVPHHRLEDEKVRKHLANSSSLSPSMGPTSMSPPQAATSLLAGGSGRRAVGNITTGIPLDEKDKGPNKGDILNGAVSWTRDLMWALHAKIQQESELVDYITSLGGTFPFEQTEEEKRMRSELLDAMVKNDASTFSYSRAPGSRLRVPKHTNLEGEAIDHSIRSPQSLSPVNLSGDGSASGSAGHGRGQGAPQQGQGQGQFWNDYNSGGSGRGSMSFKEEDEYGMDMS
ncbi:MAG: hypothetical protein M1817_001700 [Caeruleum heppii]|nr:MAG: hypothetical protein M1817_001700 [Caeruleum heppii]